MKRLLHILFYLICVFSFTLISSCKKENEPIKECNRTILVYMIATNNLGTSGYGDLDIGEMKDAVGSVDMNDCRLIVYYTSFYSKSPILFELKKENGIVRKETLKTYSNDYKSTSVERMSQVMQDIKTLSPSKSYGLVLWSHSTGWALSLSKSKINMSKSDSSQIPLYRNFGNDSGNEMTLTELSSAIPDNMFYFIYADVCYMGSIEIAYQLRNKTHFFIGSPTLLPAEGMPYDKNIPEFVKDTPNLMQACKNTYNYYNLKTGNNKSLSISLVDCSQLTDLSAFCKRYFDNNYVERQSLQGYINTSEADCIYYDFAQYSHGWLSDEYIDTFESYLSKCIIYKASTDYIFGQLYIDANKFSGLSTYKLGCSTEENENYYYTLDWYKDVFKK